MREECAPLEITSRSLESCALQSKENLQTDELPGRSMELVCCLKKPAVQIYPSPAGFLSFAGRESR
jgi:hypothetical protein